MTPVTQEWVDAVEAKLAELQNNCVKLVQNYWIPFNAFLIAALYIPYIAGSALSGRWFVASLSLYWIRFWPFVFAIYCLVVLWFEHAMHWAILAGAFSLGTFAILRQERLLFFLFLWDRC
jgi:hypothetical protein